MKKYNKLPKLTLIFCLVLNPLIMSCTIEEALSRTGKAAASTATALLTPIPVETEKQLGKQVNEQLQKEFKIYTASPEVGEYVEALGQKLAGSSSRKDEIDFSFTVLEDKLVNAFAVPGGAIYITTALLSNLKNEAELAAVLGHEIAHIDQKHSVNSMKQAIVAQGISDAAFEQGDSELLKTMVNLSFGLVLKGFNREQEKEADSVGTKLIIKFDYAPDSIIGFFETLLKLNEEPGKDSLLRFLSTHPGSEERIEEINSFIAEEKLVVEKPLSNSEEFKKIQVLLPAESGSN